MLERYAHQWAGDLAKEFALGPPSTHHGKVELARKIIAALKGKGKVEMEDCCGIRSTIAWLELCSGHATKLVELDGVEVSIATGAAPSH